MQAGSPVAAATLLLSIQGGGLSHLSMCMDEFGVPGAVTLRVVSVCFRVGDDIASLVVSSNPTFRLLMAIDIGWMACVISMVLYVNTKRGRLYAKQQLQQLQQQQQPEDPSNPEHSTPPPPLPQRLPANSKAGSWKNLLKGAIIAQDEHKDVLLPSPSFALQNQLGVLLQRRKPHAKLLPPLGASSACSRATDYELSSTVAAGGGSGKRLGAAFERSISMPMSDRVSSSSSRGSRAGARSSFPPMDACSEASAV